MLSDKTYKIILALSMILAMFLIIQNYNIKEKIVQNSERLKLTERVENNKESTSKEFGFTDILEEVSTRKEIKINNLSSKKENKEANMEMSILGDIIVVKDILKDIKDKDNYRSIDSIKINRDEDNNIVTRVNIEFIKNK